MIIKGDANVSKVMYTTIGAYVSRIVIRYKKTRINLNFKIKPTENFLDKLDVSQMFKTSWFPHSVGK